MATLASLLIALGIDAGDYEKGLKKVEGTTVSSTRKITDILTNIGGMAITGGIAVAGAGLAAMGGFLAYATKEASEAQLVQAQLAATLESTGGVAGVTAEMANDLANSLSSVTRYTDEAVLEGQNLLLTFTNIGKDIFPETTQTILDMSTALGQDLSASAMQLGKALQDPIQGVTALRRVGVNFTDAQMDMIKAMVEAGNTAGAQKMILEELKKEFGGSAEAAGKTFVGQLDILKNSLSNVAEEAGMVLLPVLTDVFQQISPLILDLAEDIASFVQSDRFKQWLADTALFIKNDLIPAILDFGRWLKNDLVPAVREAWTWFNANIVPVLKTLAEILRVVLPPLMAAFVEGWKVQVWIVTQVVDIFTRTFDAIAALFNKVKVVVEEATAYIRNRDWFGLGRSIVLGIVGGIGAFAGVLISAVANMAHQALAAIKSALGIASPSQVFADEVGLQMGLGVLQGFRKGLTGIETNIPVMNNVRGMQPIFIHYESRPFISTAEEMDFENKITPLLENWKRKNF